MRVNTLFTTLTLLVLVTVGCAQLPDPTREFVDELVVRNESTDTLHDVVLRVPATKTVIRTNTLTAGAEYAVKFPATRNPRHTATLSWTRNGNSVRRPVLTHIADNADSVNPQQILVRIFGNDRLESKITPHKSR